MSFGVRLREARVKKDLTQEGLGKGLGTNGDDAGKAVVSGWEKDRHFPRADQLAMICDKLGVSADYLLFGKIVATNLSPESAAVATEIDTFSGQQRDQVILACRAVISAARGGRPRPQQGSEAA